MTYPISIELESKRETVLISLALQKLFGELDSDDLSEAQRSLLWDDTETINNLLGKLPSEDMPYDL